MSKGLIKIANVTPVINIDSRFPNNIEFVQDCFRKKGLNLEDMAHFLLHDYKIWSDDHSVHPMEGLAPRKYGTMIFDHRMPSEPGVRTTRYREALEVFVQKADEYSNLIRGDFGYALTYPQAFHRVQKTFEALGWDIEIIRPSK